MQTRDHSVIDMVKSAVSRNHVKLAYQPVVSGHDTRRIAFYEGLIRILDEGGRVIPAREFIGAIEATETGREIDCIALRQGLKALTDYPDLRLSLNMSARSIGYERWVQILRRALRADTTVGERLILEITESSALVVPELVVNFMATLRRDGICFALDDFGSGYTSFRYLKDFYFDVLKIDGQFIRGIATDADNQIIAKAMLHLAQEFDMICVAESVESSDDARYLQDMGMDCMQGYVFGAPTVNPSWDIDSPVAARG